MNEKHKSYGALISIIAAIFWGFSGTCSQYIFENFPIDASHLTALRMLSAGVIVVATGFVTEKMVNRKSSPKDQQDNMLGIFKEKEDVFQLILFSIFGIMLCQLSYLKAIYWTNSGTATILQYTGPVMIMVITCFLAHRLPTKKEVTAIILAMAGTFLLATHGNIHSMVITPKGLTWGIMAAVTLVTYNMIPQRIIKKFGSMSVTGYGMVLGGIVLSFMTKVWTCQLPTDVRFYLAFGSVVFFGTVLAFTMFLWGVAQIGPVKASLIASLEPVAATVFMILWLGVKFHYMDFIGFTCIFLTVFLLLKKE